MPEFPNFYMINAYWDNPGGSVLVGYYAVERTTADVWSFPVCGRYTSPTLRKLQQTLRNSIGLTNAEYQKVRKPGPSCGSGQTPAVLKMDRPRSEALAKPVAKGK